MTASFPTSVKSFTTKADNVDDVMAADVNGIQDEVVAIETHLVTNYGVFKPLTTPLTSTAWDGDAYSTTSKTLIDLSAVFGVPAGVKAVLAQIIAADSGSAASTTIFFGLAPNNTSGQNSLMAIGRGLPNDTLVYQTGVVPCDANGDIYYQIDASNTGTMDCWLRIWGYWV